VPAGTDVRIALELSRGTVGARLLSICMLLDPLGVAAPLESAA
jgi:hypothetical protein